MIRTGEKHTFGFNMKEPLRGVPMITSQEHLLERLRAIWSSTQTGTPDYVHIERHGTRSPEGEADKPC